MNKIIREDIQEKIDNLAEKVENALITEPDLKVVMTVLMTNLQRAIDCYEDKKSMRQMVLDIMSKPIEDYTNQYESKNNQ